MMKKLPLTTLLIFAFCAASMAESGYRLHRNSAMNATLATSGCIIFWGDGLTGMNEWWEAFGCDPNIHNRGISGQFTSNMLDETDRIGNAHPSKLFIMAGGSDLAIRGLDNPDRIAANMKAIVENVGRISPETEIYIQSILPTNGTLIPDQSMILRTNRMYEEICDSHFNITYVDLYSHFVNPVTGFIHPEYTSDGAHLTGRGYALWCNLIAGLVGRPSVLGSQDFKDLDASGISDKILARLTVNSHLPLHEDDILMLGDETVCVGEWYELTGSELFKNRGCGWQRAQTGASELAAAVPAALSSGNPGRIFVYVGASDAIKGRLDLFKEGFNALADSLAKYGEGASITVSTLAPMRTAEFEPVDVTPFNAEIARIAGERGYSLFDVYSILTDKDGNADPSYFIRGLIAGKGYRQIASHLNRFYGIQERNNRILDISIYRNSGYTGCGNRGEKLLTAEITSNIRPLLKSVSVRVDALPSDVSWLHLSYKGKVIRSAKVVEGKKFYTFNVWKVITRESTLDITADISDDAVEGHKVSAEIMEIRGSKMSEGNRFYPGPGSLEILRTRRQVFAHAEIGSPFWRNAAMAVLPDSSLVAISDRMQTGESGLPNNSDVCCRISTDGGREWGETTEMATGGGYGKGYSGPAVTLASNGDLIALFSGGYGQALTGFDQSSAIYSIRSRDGGRTWEELTDITNQIRDMEKHPELTASDFAMVSPGSAIRLDNEGLMAFLSCGKPGSQQDIYAIRTFDNGCNWSISGPVMHDAFWGSATKLKDGTILCSACNSTTRKWARSTDGGKTWENGVWEGLSVPASKTDLLCLSDGTLVQVLQEGFECERLRFYTSTDGGNTWRSGKYLCKCEESGTSLREMPDGTIGIYTEERINNTCKLWFMNVSREWLLRQ